MFIAHLPSGYLLAKTLQQKKYAINLPIKTFFGSVMLGAIFPDIDLFYFYFWDHRSVHHHQYFLHWFSFWIPFFLLAYYFFKQYSQSTSRFAFLAEHYSIFSWICLLVMSGYLRRLFNSPMHLQAILISKTTCYDYDLDGLIK